MSRRFLGAAALPFAALLAACGSVQTSDADEREASIYAAVLDAVLSDSAVPPSDDTTGTPIFVATEDAEPPLSLEVQTGIVDALPEYGALRFLDDPSEAVDEDEPGRPVRDEGMLVTLGGIPSSGDTVTVDAERYVHAGDSGSYRITVERTGTEWIATGGSEE